MIRFHSLTRPEYCYETADEVNYRDGNVIDSRLHEYWAGNDGIVKHAHSYAIPTENWIDFFASLADYLHTHKEDIKEIATYFPLPLCHKKIDFFLTLKYDADKRRYYNASELKVSSSPSKANDRRWELVPEWANGSSESCLRFLVTYDKALYRFAYYLQIRDRAYELNNYSDPMPGHAIGYADEDCNAFYNLKSAFESVSLLVNGYREEDRANRMFESLRYNWIDRQGVKQTEAA